MTVSQIKLKVQTPSGPVLPGRGFYQLEEDALYVQIAPFSREFRFFSFLESEFVHLDLDKEDLILDFGAASCEISRYLAAQGYNVVAFHISHELLNFSREARCGNLLQYVVGDCESTPFKSRAFNKVICWNILHHLPNTELAIYELSRIMRGNGIIMLLEPNALNPVKRLRESHWRKEGIIE